MEIIFVTIPVTLLFIAGGAAIFFWANKGGQFDDLDSPAHRILFDDDQDEQNTNANNDDQTQENKKENKDTPQ